MGVHTYKHQSVDNVSDRPKRGGILTEGYDYDFSRVDPATGAHVDPAWCAIYETALVCDEDGTPGPMLADSWAVTDDGLTWTLRIRSDATFQSGVHCSAQRVAEAFRLHRDPAESPVNQFFWSPVRDVGWDQFSVFLRLKQPYIRMPSLLRSWHAAIHNQQLRGELGRDYGRGVADGTGPFRLTLWEPSVFMEAVRSDTYRGSSVRWFSNRGTAYLDRIRWVSILREDERASALESGSVDVVQNPSLLHVDRLTRNPELRVHSFQQSALAYLAVDHETSSLGLNDVRVRQALSHAIDRNLIVEQAMAGQGTPAYGPVPSGSPWFDPGVSVFNQFSPERSMALLDAAGFHPDRSGIRLRLRALVLEDATLRRAASMVKTMLHQVGVILELIEVDGFAEFYGRVGGHPEAFISKFLWPDPVDALIGFISSSYHSGPNWQRAAIQSIDLACDAWLSAGDDADLKRAGSRIQLLSAEHLPLIPLYFPNTAWGHHKRVRGWKVMASNLYPFYNDVWISEDPI